MRILQQWNGNVDWHTCRPVAELVGGTTFKFWWWGAAAAVCDQQQSVVFSLCKTECQSDVCETLTWVKWWEMCFSGDCAEPDSSRCYPAPLALADDFGKFRCFLGLVCFFVVKHWGCGGGSWDFPDKLSVREEDNRAALCEGSLLWLIFTKTKCGFFWGEGNHTTP